MRAVKPYSTAHLVQSGERARLCSKETQTLQFNQPICRVPNAEWCVNTAPSGARVFVEKREGCPLLYTHVCVQHTVRTHTALTHMPRSRTRHALTHARLSRTHTLTHAHTHSLTAHTHSPHTPHTPRTHAHTTQHAFLWSFCLFVLSFVALTTYTPHARTTRTHHSAHN